jgi:hypothetical protein
MDSRAGWRDKLAATKPGRARLGKRPLQDLEAAEVGAGVAVNFHYDAGFQGIMRANWQTQPWLTVPEKFPLGASGGRLRLKGLAGSAPTCSGKIAGLAIANCSSVS